MPPHAGDGTRRVAVSREIKTNSLAKKRKGHLADILRPPPSGTARANGILGSGEEGNARSAASPSYPQRSSGARYRPRLPLSRQSVICGSNSKEAAIFKFCNLNFRRAR